MPLSKFHIDNRFEIELLPEGLFAVVRFTDITASVIVTSEMGRNFLQVFKVEIVIYGLYFLISKNAFSKHTPIISMDMWIIGVING